MTVPVRTRFSRSSPIRGSERGVLVKKLIALVLAFIFLAAVAAADYMSWDEWFSAYTDDDLQWIAARCRELLLEHGKKPFTLNPGVYIVGEDFPAGTYTAKLKLNQYDTGSCNFTVWADSNAYMFGLYYFSTLLSTFTSSTEIGRFRLNDGNIVEVDGTLIMDYYNGIQTEE